MAVIAGRCPATGDLLEVVTRGSLIDSVRRHKSSDHDAGWLLPGLIDLQVNGYAGFDVNGDAVTPEAVMAITQELGRRGITTWTPTIITASTESILESLRCIAVARATDPSAHAAISCVHVEGPFLSPQDGPRGAHSADHVRPISAPEVASWVDVNNCFEGAAPLGYVTVSPHADEAPHHIARIAALGVQVAVGHTHATSEQVQRAVDAGATLSTHLGNGIAATLPRHPNAIWSQLADDRMTAGFIGDGHHLPAETLTSMLRAKGPGRRFLVSDSVALAGSPAGVYHQPVGGAVELHADGRLTLAGSPLLAGSAVSLADVVSYVLRHTPFTLSDIVEMVSTTPARVLGRHDLGRIQAGARADVIVVDSLGQAAHVMRAGRPL